MSILRGEKKEVSGFWLFFCITLVVLRRFCSLSGLVGSVNNTSAVCKGRAALFPPSLPKRKSKSICLKIISGKSYASFYLPFLLMLPRCAPDVSVCSVLFQQWQGVRSGSVAVLSQEPVGSKAVSLPHPHGPTTQFQILSQCSWMCSVHTAVWGWVLKVPCGCRSCSAFEESVSKRKRMHQSLLRTPLPFVFEGIWVAVLKPRRLGSELLPCSSQLLPCVWLLGHRTR